MWTVETTTNPTARKKHPCDASRLIFREGLSKQNWKPEDHSVIDKIAQERGLVLPGTHYYKTRGLFDGVWQTFRARVDSDLICRKYGLYDE